MEQIKIYTSRKKSFGILIIALIAVAGSAWLLLRPEEFEERGSPLFVSIVGLIGVLFFGFGVFVAIWRLIRNRLFLVIDNEGIDVDPARSSSGKIAWKHIMGFSEISIHGTKLIVIHVNNPDYWIAGERSTVRRKMMKFNLGYCGSPFGIGAGVARISHAELLSVLNDNWELHRDEHHDKKGK